MTRNPEFQRQIWLNWRPSVLVVSLGLCALILALPLTMASLDKRAAALGMTALIGLWAAAVFYGSMLAGRSLREEASENTWDWQRLSALTPWQMGWGKLLGAAVPAWLYALWFALVVLFVSATWPEISRLGGLRLGGHAVALALLWGLGVQAWAMNSVLVAWGQSAKPVDSRQAWLLPMLLLLVVVVNPVFVEAYKNIFDGSGTPFLWWHIDIGYLGAAYLYGALLLALGLLALWRLLCTRLDVRTLPWAWPLGLAACGFFMAGTVAGNADWSGHGLKAFCGITTLFAVAGTALIALLHMDGHLRGWRQVQWSASRGRWREALQALPLWPVSWLLALAVSILLPGNGDKDYFFFLLICLHLLRDCLMLTGFALLAGRLRSPMGVFLVAWAVVNIALPLLAAGVAGGESVAIVQPVAGVLLGGAAGFIRGAMPWVSLGVQLLVAACWAGWVFRDRVLGFARENGAKSKT